MCGVNGIFAYNQTANAIDRAEILRTRDYMAVRGPDGSGLWLSPDLRVGFGHRRLAIIDLSETGAQPMQSVDGRLVITFNGEIYNYRELKKELEAKGYKFRSSSDTEVLLHLYAEKGVEMVDTIRGMFAFAIYDRVSGKLLLARDPYGIKPLYYADDGRTFRFASQVKALLAGGAIPSDPDPAGLVGFHLLGSVPEPFTMYEGVRALPAGTTLVVDSSGGHGPYRYYSIAQVYRDAELAAPRERPLSERDAQESVRHALLDSVRHHLVADVPVAAFLSAGVDSGALVGLMRDAGQNHIQTVTLAFEEFQGKPDDESPLAELVARQYETQHTRRVVKREEFEADLPLILDRMDQPSIDGVNTWFVAKAAHELGIKVAISGLGGDELFGSYPSFRDLPRWVRALRIPAAFPFLGQGIRRVVRPIIRTLGANPKAAGMVEFGGGYPGAWLLKRGLFMPWELEDVLSPDVVKRGLERLNVHHLISETLRPEPCSAFANVATLEASLYMRNQLLRDTDWASMAHSLEVRVPLVDTKLLERVAAVGLPPPAQPVKQRLALAPSKALPSVVTWRKKTGFSVPISRWISPALKNHSAARDWARQVFEWQGGSQIVRKGTIHTAMNGRLRVLAFVTDAHGGFGGISLYNRDVIDAMCGMEHVEEVIVLPRAKPDLGFTSPRKAFYDEASALGFWSYLWRSAANALSHKRIDLVYCAHINLLPVAAAVAIARRLPLVLAIYGIDSWQRPQGRASSWELAAISLVVSISQVTLDRFQSWSGFPSERCAILPNAIHMGDFSVGSKDNALARRLGVARRPVITTFGRMVSLERYKGFDEVIDAMPRLIQRVPDLVYVAAGDGNDRKRLEEKVHALGLGEHVIFTGRINETEKADLYRLSDAYVMPSSGEGFGFVVLEALACGIPVVASTTDGTREAVRGGELGLLVDPKDRDGLVTAVLAALSQPKVIPAGLEYFSFPNFQSRLAEALGRIPGMRAG